jgi:hypothetical protein
LCLVLGGLGTCRAQEEQSPPEPEAIDPVLQQIDEIRKVDATTPDGEARLLKLALDDQSESRLRVAALENLAAAKVATPAVQQGVLSLVSKEVEARTRRAAIFALRKVGIPAKEAVPRLIGVLDDLREPPMIRDDASGNFPASAAVRVLREYGPEAREAIPALRWAINSNNRHALWGAHVGEALSAIAPEEYPHDAQGFEGVKQAIRLLSSSVPGERRYAAEWLMKLHQQLGRNGREIGEVFAPSLPGLEQNLDHFDHDVRLANAVALLVQQPHQRAGEIVSAAIERRDSVDLWRLFEWLTKYKLHFDGSRLIILTLRNEAEHVNRRVVAAKMLADNREHEREAFEVVCRFFEDDDYRTAALAALSVFRAELLEPLRPKLEELAYERSTEGGYARIILKTKFGVVIEIEKEACRERWRLASLCAA